MVWIHLTHYRAEMLYAPQRAGNLCERQPVVKANLRIEVRKGWWNLFSYAFDVRTQHDEFVVDVFVSAVDVVEAVDFSGAFCA